jgi:hypothetical protein
MAISSLVGKTFVSELRIPLTDQMEKKNDATDVGRDSLVTLNGMAITNRVAEIRITVAISVTSGFRRISNLA